MKVTVQRQERSESTLVTFEITDHSLRTAEARSATLKILRPPRLDFRAPFVSPDVREWIHYVTWLHNLEQTAD